MENMCGVLQLPSEESSDLLKKADLKSLYFRINSLTNFK